MTAIRRYSKEEFSDILKIWYGYEVPDLHDTAGRHSYRFDIEPHIELKVTATLTLSSMEYASLESHYKNVLSERGKDYYDYLTSSKEASASFKTVAFSSLKGFPTSLRAEYHIIHILEVELDSVPLYLNCLVPEVAKIAAIRLKFGK